MLNVCEWVSLWTVSNYREAELLKSQCIHYNLLEVRKSEEPEYLKRYILYNTVTVGQFNLNSNQTFNTFKSIRYNSLDSDRLYNIMCLIWLSKG